jgi:hypothetical protein
MVDSLRRPELRVSQLPPVDALRALAPSEREQLAATLAKAEDAAALREVLDETSALGLRATLELGLTRGTLGDVVRAVGLDALLELGRARGLDVNDILSRTDAVTVRGLTAREARAVRENFGDTLDPDTIRLVFTRGAQTMGAGAMALGNHIHVDPSDPRFRLARGTTRPVDPGDDSWDGFNTIVLAHEAAHVWSYQHRGTAYAFASVAEQAQGLATTGSRGAAYGYQPDRASFWAYGEEQRAMLVQDFVAATRAKQRGHERTPTTYGGWLPVDEVLATLTPFIRQMRSAGPGVAAPGAQPEPSACAGLHFAQDGLADFVARNADRAIAGLGTLAGQAVVEGVTRAQPGRVFAGAVGVAAAGVASLVAREQNATGAQGGGSALLDQARLPRGVEVETRDGVRLGVTGAWDAPAPRRGEVVTLGAANARVEWHVGADIPLREGAALNADAHAVVGLDGRLQVARAELGVVHPEVHAQARLDVTLPRSVDAPLRALAVVDVASGAVALVAQGDASLRHGHLERAEVSARVSSRVVTAGAEVALRRRSAGLEVERAAADVSVSPYSTLSLGVRAVALPRGLEELSATLAAHGDRGTLTAAVQAERLTSAPSLGLSVTATPRAAPLSVQVNANTTPASGEWTAGIALKGRF